MSHRASNKVQETRGAKTMGALEGSLQVQLAQTTWEHIDSAMLWLTRIKLLSLVSGSKPLAAWRASSK